MAHAPCLEPLVGAPHEAREREAEHSSPRPRRGSEHRPSASRTAMLAAGAILGACFYAAIELGLLPARATSSLSLPGESSRNGAIQLNEQISALRGLAGGAAGESDQAARNR